MLLMAWSYLWTDLPTRIGLLGAAVFGLWAASCLRYVATHYTRVPGGPWTTWEKAQSQLPLPQHDQERAA